MHSLEWGNSFSGVVPALPLEAALPYLSALNHA